MLTKQSNLANFIRKEKLDLQLFSRKSLSESKLEGVPSRTTGEPSTTLSTLSASSASATAVEIKCPNCTCSFSLSVTPLSSSSCVPPHTTVQSSSSSATSGKITESKEQAETKESKEEKTAASSDRGREFALPTLTHGETCVGLKKYNLDKWRNENFSAALVGKRLSGKTTLTTKIAWQLKDSFDEILIFRGCETPCMFEKKFASHLHKNCWFTNLTEEKFIDCVQKVLDFHKFFPETRTLLIFEDLFGVLDKKTWHNPIFTHLFREGKISILATAQYLNDIPPSIRNLFFSFFFFRTDNRKTVSDIFQTCENPLSGGPSTFAEAFHFYTENYGTLVYDKSAGKDKCYWYTA